MGRGPYPVLRGPPHGAQGGGSSLRPRLGVTSSTTCVTHKHAVPHVVTLAHAMEQLELTEPKQRQR